MYTLYTHVLGGNQRFHARLGRKKGGVRGGGGGLFTVLYYAPRRSSKRSHLASLLSSSRVSRPARVLCIIYLIQKKTEKNKLAPTTTWRSPLPVHPACEAASGYAVCQGKKRVPTEQFVEIMEHNVYWVYLYSSNVCTHISI